MILPLPKGTILLPGIVQRIEVSANRPDIAALLTSLHSRLGSEPGNGRIDTIPIGCVPMASPLAGSKDQSLPPRGDASPAQDAEPPQFEPGKSTKADLFGCGVAAKVTAIEGQAAGGFAILLEGQTRIKMDKIYQERPYFEGRVSWHPDESRLSRTPSRELPLTLSNTVNAADETLEDIFQQLKVHSRELVALLRISAFFFPERRSPKLTPVLARRLDIFINKKTIAEAGSLADFMAHILETSYEQKLQILASFDVRERITKVLALLMRQIEIIKGSTRIATFTTTTVPVTIDPKPHTGEGNQGWSVVPQGRNAMMPFGMFMPPGAADPMGRRPPNEHEPDETDELKRRLDAAKLSPEAAKVAERELKRLEKMVPAQAEYAVTRSYLETLAEIPWSTVTDDHLGPDTLAKARKQLDDDHYGLEKVKKRLLEYLAVLRLKQSVNEEVEAQIKQAEQEVVALGSSSNAKVQEMVTDSNAKAGKEAVSAKLDALRSRRMVDKSPILLLVGPPGVGKTSLARSVAAALGRKFHRISLGGVRDEAEIRGHRRTYVAAMPGMIIQGLKKVGVVNPVCLLDEIDKLGHSDYRGDPSAAMLEVLDPEQNHSFVDHYVSIPYDLSKVLFIATANSLDTIPAPLLDRMEMIYLPGYTTLEKRHIATRHLVPKQVRINGLAADQIAFSQEVVTKVIESYTRESGVRNLEREIGSVCRAKAVEFADAKDGGTLETYRPELTVDDIERMLGIEKYEEEIAETTSRPGIVTGLVAYSSGGNGSILFIEVTDFPGTGSVQLTGNLRSVLKESVEVALSWVKAHAYHLGLAQDPTENIMKNRSIHVHCPSGSIPKDGPSSGIAQVIALISLFSGKAVPPTLALTVSASSYQPPPLPPPSPFFSSLISRAYVR